MIISVQYARAIAALLVLFGHAAWKGQQYSSDPWSWMNIGTSGVDLFFVISGYIMCHVTYGKKVEFGKFLKARFLRILPLYWLLTTIALAIFFIAPEIVNSSGGKTSILHSYTLLPTGNKYLIQNGWTLSYEFLFYFIFSTALVTRTKYRYLLPATILVALLVIGFSLPTNANWQRFVTSLFLTEFLMGMGAFWFTRNFAISNPIAGLFIIFSTLLLALVNMGYSPGPRQLHFGIPCLLLFVGMVSLEEFFRSYSQNWFAKTFSAIGDASFSLYLLHPFSLSAVAIVLNGAGLAIFGQPFVVSLTLSSIIAALICYRFVERPLTLTTRNWF